MVPVKVRDEDISGVRGIFFCHEGIPERHKACTHIKHNELIICSTDLNAGSMASHIVFVSVRSREGAPYSPKSDYMFFHREKMLR
jgi:hypothetical protein